jgi:osmotically-inducible protein OsmY
MRRVRKILLALALAGLSACLTGFKGDPTQLSDIQIESAVKERLAADGRIDARNIQVKVEQGVVTLGGTVPSLEDKGLAEALVSGTMVGISRLKNEIEVVRPVLKDEEIRKAVEAALRSVPALKESKLNKVTVVVHEGDVILKGTVEKPLHRRLAQKAAQSVHGVALLANLLKIVGQPRPDRDIEKDVLAYLKWAPYIDLDQIEYRVENGVVKLKGPVDHHANIFAVVNDIEKIHGVIEVDASEVTVTKVQRKA